MASTVRSSKSTMKIGTKTINIVDEHSLGLPECNSDNPNDMCKDCICWKHTRQMCS